MVFPLDKPTKAEDEKKMELWKQTEKTKDVLNRLLLHGDLEIFVYRSGDGEKLITLIRADEEKLKRFAAATQFPMALCSTKVKEKLERGLSDPITQQTLIKGVVIRDEPAVSILDPYSFCYSRYDSSEHDLFIGDGNDTPFSPTIKVKLLYNIITGPIMFGGCGIKLQSLLADNSVMAVFPLHDAALKMNLEKVWLSCGVMPWNQPFDDIREYFGEKLSLYFKFISHLTTWLLVPALGGFAIQIVVWQAGNYSHPVLPFFGIFISLWAVLMLQFWKRTEKEVAMEWGMLDFETAEPERPEYQGKYLPSPIDGSQLKYYPKSLQKKMVVGSVSVICVLIFMVLGTVAAIYCLQFYLEGFIGVNSNTVASILNVVQIQVFNLIYSKAADFTTKIENHRTENSYEESLCIKLFAFQFVNAYCSFFYLAFVAKYLEEPAYQAGMVGSNGNPYVGRCGWTDCMRPLSLNLFIIFASRLTIGNIQEVLIPYVMPYFTNKDETKELSPAEHQITLTAYDPVQDSVSKFGDIAIQFGYMIIFITALPIACFVSGIIAVLRIQADGWVLLNLTQRPIPTGVQDIGKWQDILAIISTVAVTTNAGLICFTMDTLDGFTMIARLWIFIGFQWVVIGLQGLLSAAVSPVSQPIVTQMKRSKFIISKLIDKVHDEIDNDDDDSVFGKAKKPEIKPIMEQQYPLEKDEEDNWPYPIVANRTENNVSS